MGLFGRLFGPPSHDKFAQIVIQAFRDAGINRPMRYEPESSSIVLDDDFQKRLFLKNAYGEYCAAPNDKRKIILQNFIQGSNPPDFPESFEAAAANIFPIVRERAFFPLIALRLKMEGMEPNPVPYRLLCEHLTVHAVYDLPYCMMDVSRDQYAKWGVNLEQVLEVGTRNLQTKSRQAFDSPAPGVYVSPWKDNYDASRLFLTDVITKLNVKGDHVAIIPNRDTLIVTGSADAAGIEMMTTLASATVEQPRFMGAIPVRLQNGQWQPFYLPKDHPSYVALNRLALITRTNEYSEQQTSLNALHEKEGKDIYVAAYTAMQMKDSNEQLSFCAWSEGVPSLLPRTDAVAFCRPTMPDNQQMAGMAEWDRVRQVMGGAMVRTDEYPERYLVDSFPTKEQLASMGSIL